jgi:hypothetical protein
MKNRIAGLLACALAGVGGWTTMEAQDSTAARAPAPAPAPGAAPTRYALVTVAGKPLPATMEQARDCREDVTAGSLALRDDGTWLLETTKREVCGDRAETESDTDEGRYTTEGGTIRFLDEDGNPDTDRDQDDNIDLDDLTTGTLAGDGTLTAKLDDGRTTLVFRK